MNSYKPSTSRVALGFTAIAMTAMTMGALVVLPAKLEYVAVAATKAPTEVVVSPARTDMVEQVGPEEHATSIAQFSGRKDCAGAVANCFRVTEPVQVIRDRTFMAKVRAMAIHILAKERP